MPRHRCKLCDASTHDPRHWFEIVLVAEGRTLEFCHRHALAAEALHELGIPGDAVVDRLRRLLKNNYRSE